MNVVHFITRLIIGGAQENTLLTVEDQHRDFGDKVTLIAGPGLGPEGSLEERARRGGFDFRVLPELHRAIRPWQDWKAYRSLLRMLREIKPDIVYVSMSGYGHTGRDHAFTTFGPVAQAASGLTHLSGLPGAPPAGWGWSYMDDTGGMYGAMCALTGLYHRNKTGKGQHIDQSQMVSSVALNGPSLLDLTANALTLSNATAASVFTAIPAVGSAPTACG